MGDLVLLRPGFETTWTIEGVLVRGNGLAFDESRATGESDKSFKTPGQEAYDKFASRIWQPDPFIYSGSSDLEGAGVFLVTAVGANSSGGKTILALTSKTYLPISARQLYDTVEMKTAIGGIGVVACLFLGMFVKFMVQQARTDVSSMEKARWFLDVWILTSSVMFVVFLMTLTLAADLAIFFVTSNLASLNCYLQNNGQMETLRTATSVILGLDALHQLDQAVIDTVGVGTNVWKFDSLGPLRGQDPDTQLSLCTFAEAIASTSGAYKLEENGRAIYIGPDVEGALLKHANNSFGGHLQVDQLIRPEYEPQSGRKEKPFAVSKVNMQDGSASTNLRVYVMGDCRELVKRCDKVAETTNLGYLQASAFDNETADHICHQISPDWTKALTFAYCDLDPIANNRRVWKSISDFQLGHGRRDNNYQVRKKVMYFDGRSAVYLGMIGLKAPLRVNTRENIQVFQRAGWFVSMYTTEPEEMTLETARRCGILVPGGLVAKSSDFHALNAKARRVLLPKLCALLDDGPDNAAAASFVVELQNMKEQIVWISSGRRPDVSRRQPDATTLYTILEEDSSHYLPALPRSGFHMVITNRGSSSSIPKIIPWIRSIRYRLQVLAQTSLLFSITILCVAVVSALSDTVTISVLRPVHILWLCLVLDGLAALALATEPPHPGVITDKPYPKSAPLLTPSMWKVIVGQSVYRLAVLFALAYGSPNLLQHNKDDLSQTGTLIFSTLAWMQIFGLWNCRQLRTYASCREFIQHARLFLCWFILISTAQVLILLFGGRAFGLAHLGVREWAIALIAGALTIPLGVLVRMIPDTLLWKLTPRSLARLFLSQVGEGEPWEDSEKEQSREDMWLPDWREKEMSELFRRRDSWPWRARRGNSRFQCELPSYGNH